MEVVSVVLFLLILFGCLVFALYWARKEICKRIEFQDVLMRFLKHRLGEEAKKEDLSSKNK